MNAGYDLSYTYANNSQQIANIADASYRAERSSGTYATRSVASDSIDHKTLSYRYDANGNRHPAISDNGYVSNYWYDASGERTVKQSGGSEGVFVNGVLSSARTQTSKFTAYVSPYLVVSSGGNYSKHIYVGSQRITSKLSNSLIFDESRNPLSIAKANNSVEPINATDYSAKFNTLTGTIAERFDSLGVIYKGTVQSGGLTTQGTTSGVTPQYFYHPDHLGSSSLITDENGLMVQHIQYVPFGEVFVEERTTSWSTPYKFNAKELDPETGLYYYGARYYDPRTSVWLSVDPLAEGYPNISSYVYCAENPIIYVDPDGMQLKGVSKNDANKMHEDINTVFADDKFAGFRSLITRTGKKGNGDTFNKIDSEALASYLKGAEGLTNDDKALIEIVSNTINSNDVHEVEYAAASDELPDMSMASPELKAAFDKNGWTITAGLIGSQTKKTENGSYALIVEGGKSANDYLNTSTNKLVANPGGRAGTSFHENFGHGRSLATGRGDANQHPDAIRLENLTLRVMGIGLIQRTGKDHGPMTPVVGPSILPGYR